MDYQREKKYVGNLDQLFRVSRVRCEEGRADGVSMLEVKNRSGMEFSVNLSRGMDIPFLSFYGENVGYISPCGVTSPLYFDDKENGFLKSFTAGFLTTCGLKMAGASCVYEGTQYGLHGNFSHIPAENVRYEIVEENGSVYAEIAGTMRDGVIFGDRLRLDRRIRCGYRERKFTLHDVVTNEGYKRARHMILYHCNIGYPLLSPNCELYLPSSDVRPRNEHAEKGLADYLHLQEPDSDYEEMCYYHRLIPDGGGYAAVGIFNPDLDIGVALKFKQDTLDHFIQWKMMGAGDYVLGLEPANSTIDGIADAAANGSLKYLEPWESVEYEIEIKILKHKEEFQQLKEGIRL